MKWIDVKFTDELFVQTDISVSADDIINDSTPSLRDTIINDLIKKREMNLLYHCRYKLADIVKMIDAANTTDDLNLELLKVLVSDIKKVFGENL